MDVASLLRRAVEQGEVAAIHVDEFPLPKEVIKRIVSLGDFCIFKDFILVPLCKCQKHLFCPYGVIARHGVRSDNH